MSPLAPESGDEGDVRPRHALGPDEDAIGAAPELEALDTAAADQGHRSEEQLSFGQHVVAFIKELFVVVVGAIIVASLLRGFVGQMFLIPSSSMEDTLLINDRVAVEKISTVKRGQVVVFADPGRWLSGPPAEERGPIGQAMEFIGILPDTGTEHLIKRVVGLPGDEVICCDAKGRITVNGRALDEDGYLYAEPDGQKVSPSEIEFDVVVPEDRMFVMGDHRNNSRDSRCHLNDESAGLVKGSNAFVSLDLVVGHAVAIVWPLSSTTHLKIPTTFDSVPPGKDPAPAKPVIDAGPEASC